MTASPFPSSRKLTKDAKKEVAKYKAQLDTIRDRVNSPKSAALWARFASQVQLLEAIRVAASNGQHIAVPNLLRSLLESVVYCKLENDMDDKAILNSGYAYKLKYANKAIHQIPDEYSKEELETAKEYKEELQDKIAATAQGSSTQPTPKDIEAKFTLAGMHKDYVTFYTLLSSDVHNNMEALDQRHAELVNDTPKMKWFIAAEQNLGAHLKKAIELLEDVKPLLDALCASLATTHVHSSKATRPSPAAQSS